MFSCRMGHYSADGKSIVLERIEPDGLWDSETNNHNHNHNEVFV